MTKLYDVPRNSMIRLLEKPSTPPASPTPDDILRFSHCDGMYSLCYNSDNTPVHLAAYTEVEIIGRWEHHAN